MSSESTTPATSGDLAEIVVRCECGSQRPLGEAAFAERRLLGHCDGSRPWLGPYYAKEACGEPNRLLVRSASNAYFPQVMSVIALPDENESLEKAVAHVWQFLEAAESADDVKHERKKAIVRSALDVLNPDDKDQLLGKIDSAEKKVAKK